MFDGALIRRILFLGLVEAVGVTVLSFWLVAEAGIILGQVFVGRAVRSDRHSTVRVGPLSNPAARKALAVPRTLARVTIPATPGCSSSPPRPDTP